MNAFFRLGNMARLTLAVALTVTVMPVVTVAGEPLLPYLQTSASSTDGYVFEQEVVPAAADDSSVQFMEIQVSGEDLPARQMDASDDSNSDEDSSDNHDFDYSSRCNCASGCSGGGCSGGGCSSNMCCPCDSSLPRILIVGPSWHCVAGTEFTFLVPDIDDGSLNAVFTDSDGVDTVSNDGFDLGGMAYAPRVWVGVQAGCWGVVGRFWHLDTCDSAFDPFEANGFGYGLDSDLEMQTIDIELTREFCVRGGKLLGTAGVRYASFDHGSSLSTIVQSDPTDAVYSTQSLFRQFARGTGLTGSLSGSKPICGTVLSCFYNVRGSVLWGHTDTFAESDVAMANTLGMTSSVHGASAQMEDPFYIAEAQLGLIAERQLQCYPANAFFRVAFEFQHWSGDDSTAFAESFTGITGPPSSVQTANASTSGMDANLFGFSIGTGLTY